MRILAHLQYGWNESHFEQSFIEQHLVSLVNKLQNPERYFYPPQA